MQKTFKNKKKVTRVLTLQNRKKLMRGFTMIETLFAISIFTLVVLTLTLFSRNIWVYGSYISAGLNDVNIARQAMKTMTAEIRTASTADTGAYTISSASANTFTFHSDIDNDGLKDKVRYFLNGSTLQKGVIKPTGSPLTYNGADEKISTLVLNITNTSIFDYYDKNYSGTEAPLASPVAIASIRLVKINVTTDKDVNQAPAPMTFSTQVSIRNLKDNL